MDNRIGDSIRVRQRPRWQRGCVSRLKDVRKREDTQKKREALFKTSSDLVASSNKPQRCSRFGGLPKLLMNASLMGTHHVGWKKGSHRRSREWTGDTRSEGLSEDPHSLKSSSYVLEAIPMSGRLCLGTWWGTRDNTRSQVGLDFGCWQHRREGATAGDEMRLFELLGSMRE